MSEREKLFLDMVRALEKLKPEKVNELEECLKEWYGDDPDKQAFAKALLSIKRKDVAE